jgi:hypothetical protein
MELKINQLEFPTLELAWEGINEFMVNEEDKVRAMGGGNYGTELVMYDTFIHIFKATIHPKFDFGKILGYRYKKWSKLINNYINFNYLDIVKSEILSRENKRSSHYNYTFHFDNKHGSGKDCLISLSFCRRKNQKIPYVIWTTRASEVTSRLLFDFLLIQRILEYVYGKEKAHTCEVVCYIPFCYVNIERYLIYMAYKGRNESVYRTKEKERNRQGTPLVYTPFQEKCLAKYDEFLHKDIDLIKYKVHKRSAVQVKQTLDHIPHLYAKDLTFPFKNKKNVRDIEKLDKSLTKL